jgi:adenylate kinase family enzyme
VKFKYVFLLGRPGCGKSALYRELEKRLLESGQATTCERVDDFPKLWARIQADDAREREGRERLFTRMIGDGRLEITNRAVLVRVLNEILQEVSSDVLQIDKPDHVVFIEFARGSYLEAIQSFDRAVLEDCLVIYLQVSFETCWARNVARHEAAVARGGDDHLVPREEMEWFYLVDDRDAFVRAMVNRQIPVVVVDNEPDGEDYLIEQVASLYQRLF